MKNSFVKDLKPGHQVADVFVLRKKELKDYDGKRFLKLELGDSSGKIDAVAWEGAERFYPLAEKGDVVRIEGWVATYRGMPQISLEDIKKAQAGEFDFKDLLPRGTEDPDRLLERFKQKCSSVENRYLKLLLADLTGDAELTEKLKLAPGGKLWHHCYLGGLLEHTLRVTNLCELAAQTYELIDRDLLVAGGLLHDIGKISEYSTSGLIEKTDQGRLVGHVVLGDQIISSRIERIEGFPGQLALSLRHLILSHQGRLECASPVVPQTIEAIVLHYADELDAKADAFSRVIAQFKDSGEKWSNWVSLIDRYIYWDKTNSQEGEG